MAPLRPRRAVPSRGLLAAACVAAALVTGACGGDDAPRRGEGRSSEAYTDRAPAAVVEDARAAMSGLEAFHMSGTLGRSDRPVDVDLALAADGRCTGTIGVDGGEAEVRAVDGQAWFRPDAAVWRSIAGADADRVRAAVGERWLVLDDATLRDLCDFRAILRGLISPPEDGRRYTHAGTDEIDGASVLRIQSDGVAGTSFGYVRDAAPHYLVRTERPGGEAPATVTFSDFDVAPEVEAPAPAEVVGPAELDRLGG